MPSLFVLTHSPTHFALDPPNPAGQFHTSIQVNNTATPHLMYTTYISISCLYYYPFSSLHFFYYLGQAGWLRLSPSDTLPPAGLPSVIRSCFDPVLSHLPPRGPPRFPAKRCPSPRPLSPRPLIPEAQRGGSEGPGLAP